MSDILRQQRIMSLRALAALLSLCFAVSCAGPKGPDGAAGPSGPEGPKGDPGDDFMAMPSVSSVSPTRLAVGLSSDVTITGFATKWMSSVQVSFGQGVTVNSVKLGSQTGLVANITVAANAMPGPRDVTVTQGTEVSTFTAVFRIVPLFEVMPIGTASRGGYWFYDVRSNDPEFSFPSSTSVSVSPTPAMGVMQASLTSLTPRRAVVRVHSDFVAPLQRYEVTLDYGQSLSLPGFDLAEKVELMLGEGAPLTGITLLPYEAKLVKLTAGATPKETVLHVSQGAGAKNVQLILLDDTGNPRSTSGSTGAPAPGNDMVLMPSATGTWLLLSETAGTGAMNVSLHPLVDVVGTTEVEPNNVSTEAMALTLAAFGSDRGARITGGATYNEPDWYKVTLSDGDIGKRIHLRIYTLDYIWFDTRTLKPDGTSIGTSNISSITTDVYSAPITAAGEYTIELIGDDDGAYDFVVSVQ